ncbi:hypothetical protein KAM344_39970 [Aeromonas caviae]|nr:hypothetical protein KAM344_39970 [Aeromonas caviae]
MDKTHWITDRSFKLLLVKTLKEKTAFIAKDFGFDDFYVGDFGVNDVHFYLGNLD